MEGYRFRVLVRPQAVDRSYGEFRPGVHHGQIMPGDWDQATYPVTGNPLARMAFAHWRDGVSWEETGAVEHQMARIRAHGPLYADGLRVRDDVLRRYNAWTSSSRPPAERGRSRRRPTPWTGSTCTWTATAWRCSGSEVCIGS